MRTQNHPVKRTQPSHRSAVRAAERVVPTLAEAVVIEAVDELMPVLG
jgi:hypothetical protein